MGGPFSGTHLVATPAFNFLLDQEACHQNLKVVSETVVEWDTTANRSNFSLFLSEKNIKLFFPAQDVRIRSASGQRSPSPALKSMSPRRSKIKDRFTGESFTILGTV